MSVHFFPSFDVRCQKKWLFFFGGRETPEPHSSTGSSKAQGASIQDTTYGKHHRTSHHHSDPTPVQLTDSPCVLSLQAGCRGGATLRSLQMTTKCKWSITGSGPSTTANGPSSLLPHSSKSVFSGRDENMHFFGFTFLRICFCVFLCFFHAV